MKSYNRKSIFGAVTGVSIILIIIYSTPLAGLFFTYAISRESAMFITALVFTVSILTLNLGFTSRREIVSTGQSGVWLSYLALVLGFIGLLLTAATSLNFIS